MLCLHAVSKRTYDAPPFVGRVSTNSKRPVPLRDREVLLCTDPSSMQVTGFRACLLGQHQGRADGAVLNLPPALSHLSDGDVIKVHPRAGDIRVLYRRASDSNTLLLTEQCNCAWIMCCQPPKPGDDDRTEEVLQTIELIHPATNELGLSGGEPTLYPDGLLRVIQKAKSYLPMSALHLLSNAREFKHLRFAERLVSIRHPELVVGVPIHADIADLHDWIAQRRGAFDEAILGLMNLRRCGVRVEVRVVVHRLNAGRLVPLSHFIGRNLAFCTHVAIMGMEVHGWALAQRQQL
jgi:His-Xaa-Ser system radical SAM maturase HxsC